MDQLYSKYEMLFYAEKIPEYEKFNEFIAQIPEIATADALTMDVLKAARMQKIPGDKTEIMYRILTPPEKEALYNRIRIEKELKEEPEEDLEDQLDEI